MKPDQRRKILDALEECKEILAMQTQPCRVDPLYGDEVKELGERIGYGAMMLTASALWEQRLFERHGITSGAHGVAVGRTSSQKALGLVEEALKVVNSLQPRKARRSKRYQ